MDAQPLHVGTARVKKLKYMLLSGHHVTGDQIVYHDSAYQLWRRSWQHTFGELKTDAVLRADDFLRSNVIGGLFDGHDAVALVLYTYFNLELEAFRDHSYITSTYPGEIIAGLRSRGIRETLSQEYLTLHSGWRKSVIGVPLAEVILGLSAKLLESSGFSAMLGVTRNERRVNEILYGYGGRCLAANQVKHNVAVDLISLERGKTHPGGSSEVNHWIEFFWDRRVDMAGFEELARKNRETEAA